MGLNSTLDTYKELTSELEDRSEEIIQSDDRGEKRGKYRKEHKIHIRL